MKCFSLIFLIALLHYSHMSYASTLGDQAAMDRNHPFAAFTIDREDYKYPTVLHWIDNQNIAFLDGPLKTNNLSIIDVDSSEKRVYTVDSTNFCVDGDENIYFTKLVNGQTILSILKDGKLEISDKTSQEGFNYSTCRWNPGLQKNPRLLINSPAFGDFVIESGGISEIFGERPLETKKDGIVIDFTKDNVNAPIHLSPIRYLKATLLHRTIFDVDQDLWRKDGYFDGIFIIHSDGKIEQVSIPDGEWNGQSGSTSINWTAYGYLVSSTSFSTSDDPHAGLFLVRPDGKGTQLMRGLVEEVVVSPDGQRVAFLYQPKLTNTPDISIMVMTLH